MKSVVIFAGDAITHKLVSRIGVEFITTLTADDAVDLFRDRHSNILVVSEQFIDNKKELEAGLGYQVTIPILIANEKKSRNAAEFLAIFSETEDKDFILSTIAFLDKKLSIIDSVMNRERNMSDADGSSLQLELTKAKIHTIIALSWLAQSRDTETGEHLDRVRKLSKLIAEKLDSEICTPEFIFDISYASILHDIGKVGIPDFILLKPGKLTDQEFETMRAHCAIGALTLQKVIDLYSHNPTMLVAKNIALHHHERWDGTGYPLGLTKTETPLEARIVSVVDAYDAIRSKRSYKKALSHEQALAEIHKYSGTQFDPEIVATLEQLAEQIREFYENI